jgi:SAM-dependent methyltransferase
MSNLTIEDTWLHQILQCPDCGAALRFESVEAVAAHCEHCSFAPLGNDFRPRQPVRRSLEFPTQYEAGDDLQTVAVGPPPLTYSGPPPHRNAIDVFSLLERLQSLGQATALDLGCGAGEFGPVFQWLGYRYVGVDVTTQGPTILADAHALPFTDRSFDVVFSMAVLEHVHNPFLALSEVHRVLKPGGVFLGVAAFGEPFHASYFHASPWGMLALLCATGFVPLRLWSCRDTLAALADMSAYPKAIRWMLRFVALIARVPWLSPRRWWCADRSALAALKTAGSIGFHARKPQ